jgi:hypothetical protein
MTILLWISAFVFGFVVGYFWREPRTSRIENDGIWLEESNPQLIEPNAKGLVIKHWWVDAAGVAHYAEAPDKVGPWTEHPLTKEPE